jgi:hypothetical protein
MKLNLLVLLLSWSYAVNADFDLYSGYGYVGTGVVIGLGGQPEAPYFAHNWHVFGGEPDCKDAWRAKTFPDTDDVSGEKIGVRCQPFSACWGNGDPAGIDVLEMHFLNDPFLHFSK